MFNNIKIDKTMKQLFQLSAQTKLFVRMCLY